MIKYYFPPNYTFKQVVNWLLIRFPHWNKLGIFLNTTWSKCYGVTTHKEYKYRNKIIF